MTDTENMDYEEGDDERVQAGVFLMFSTTLYVKLCSKFSFNSSCRM